MAEAGGGRSGSGPARPPEWGRDGEEARSREGLGGAEGRGSSREGRGADVRRRVPGRGRGRIRGGPEEPAGRRPDESPRAGVSPACPGAKVPSPAASPPELRSCQRRPPGATSSKCPPIPWITEAFAKGPGSRPRPVAGPARDSPPAINWQRLQV